MILAIVFIIIVVIVKLLYDYNLWKKHIYVKHSTEWLFMVIGSGYSIYYFAEHSKFAWWFSYPLVALMCAAFIMFFFNGLYNTARNFNWWFLGDVGSKSAITDKFFKKVGSFWQKTIQIGLLIGTITIYIIYFKK